MKIKNLLVSLGVLLCIFLMSSCDETATYIDIRNQTITSIDVRNGKLLMEGRLHAPLFIDNFLCRIENNELFIKIIIVPPPNSNTNDKFFKFEEALPDIIEKIFIEDDTHKIMIWESSQGYDKFDIGYYWKDELKKLSK